jgi:hypothetical protein
VVVVTVLELLVDSFENGIWGSASIPGRSLVLLATLTLHAAAFEVGSSDFEFVVVYAIEENNVSFAFQHSDMRTAI